MNRRTPIPPGVITLCVIFISLCISALSLLTFRQSESELAFARASAMQKHESLTADYTCRLRIEKALSMIAQGENIEDAALETRAVLEDNNLVFEQRIDGRRIIRAEVVTGEKPRLISYAALYSAIWAPDENIEVWDGDEQQ